MEKEAHTLKRFPLQDERGRFAWANLIRSGTADKRTDRPTLHFPIYVNAADELRIREMVYHDDLEAYEILDPPKTDEVAVYPTVFKNGEAIEKRWQRGQDRIIREPSEYRVRRGTDGTISIDFKTRMDEESLPKLGGMTSDMLLQTMALQN